MNLRLFIHKGLKAPVYQTTPDAIYLEVVRALDRDLKGRHRRRLHKSRIVEVLSGVFREPKIEQVLPKLSHHSTA